MTRFSKIMCGFLALAMLVFFATPADAAYSVKQIFARFSATAGETLATGNVAMLKDADGYAYKADANDAALRPAVGIIGKGGASGSTVEIIVMGVMSGWSALSEGLPGYLSETAAAVTQSSPAYSQQVGYAITATTYFFSFQNYFDSSSLTVLGTLSGATPIVAEGATADDSETSISFIDPTADRNVYIPDATGTVVLSPGATDEAATSFKGVANGIQFEGATANGSEVTLDVADPTADVTYRLPVTVAGTYSLMTSTLATNAPDVANSVWGISNGLAMGGATGGDGFELQLKPMGDPAADKSILFPVLNNAAAMITTLTTNDVDVANSVWGISNGLAMGGATGGDGFELQLKPMGDPAADKSVLFPVLNNAAGMISTLTTNDVDVANSVWGVSNGLAFGGATGGDGFEVKLTVTDPTADMTVTMPNRTGQLQMASAASALTPGAAVALTVGLSNVYTLETNDNEDTTITFSGAGTAGDEINIIFATGAGVVGDEIVTFHATLVSSTGTLTMANTASRFYVVRFISDGAHWYEVSRTAIQT